MSRGLLIFVAFFALAEIAAALYLSSINPVQGYDENWYRVNSYRFAGATYLPYVPNRPPLLPMLLAVAGDQAWLVSGGAHIVATGLVFLILRRLATAEAALGGAVVFALCGELRLYNVLQLTEMPAVCLLLLVLYCHVLRRPFWLGAATTCLVMTHWSMAVVPPVVLLALAAERRWRTVAHCLGGMLLAAVPFLVVLTLTCGNPLQLFLTHLRVQQMQTNDWWWYARKFPQLPLALIGGGLLALIWVVRQRLRCKLEQAYGISVLLLTLVATRLLLVHAIAAKSQRYLAPLIPLLLLLSVLMLAHYRPRLGRVRWAVWALLIVSVLPGRALYWQLQDLQVHPVGALSAFAEAWTRLGPEQTIYTDLNDLAVMGRTGRPVVAVTGPGSSHHPLFYRPHCPRGEVPPGAVYLTWNPGDAEVLAGGVPTNRGTLWLVRWRTGDREGEPALTAAFEMPGRAVGQPGSLRSSGSIDRPAVGEDHDHANSK